MSEWEYSSCRDSEDTGPTVAQMGSDGWECFDVVPVPPQRWDGNSPVSIYYFKRERAQAADRLSLHPDTTIEPLPDFTTHRPRKRK